MLVRNNCANSTALLKDNVNNNANTNANTQNVANAQSHNELLEKVANNLNRTTPTSSLILSDFDAVASLSDAYLSSTTTTKLTMSQGTCQGSGGVALSAPNTPSALRRATKRDKMEFNQMMMARSLHADRPLSYHGGGGGGAVGSNCVDHPSPPPVNKRHISSRSKEGHVYNRRSMPSPKVIAAAKMDIGELETLPRLDLESIELHLRAAREEERKRRSEREEIRRRLALEADGSDALGVGGLGRKHHPRLSSGGMNLQICFMNETASDSESPNSDSDCKAQPQSLPPAPSAPKKAPAQGEESAEDFFARQARLQGEARAALAAAKEVARLQLCGEREGRPGSPITLMVRHSLQKVGVGLGGRRVSRQLLTEMNVAQLQVIVNDLHSHIEKLNEGLVGMLLERDDLHMEQDSMLVDIEDLTRYLAAKYSAAGASLPLICASESILGKQQKK